VSGAEHELRREPIPDGQIVDRSFLDRRPSLSQAALRLHFVAASDEARAHAASAQAHEVTIAVDGAAVPFTLVEQEGCWAAVADVGDTSVTIAARDVPVTDVALHTVTRAPGAGSRSLGP
jgi:hypothetical protein